MVYDPDVNITDPTISIYSYSKPFLKSKPRITKCKGLCHTIHCGQTHMSLVFIENMAIPNVLKFYQSAELIFACTLVSFFSSFNFL